MGLNLWFLTLLAAHVFAAFWCPILDCDEVFNYWEPLHHLVHGTGLQTWEYAGTYALRSYLYLLLHSPIPFIIKITGYSKVVSFYALRVVIAFLTAACETHWLKSLEQRLGPRVKSWTHLFLLVSPGMFISSAAFIPSSFSMSCLLLCQSFQMRRNIAGSIFCGGVAVILGWPFCVVVLIPIGLDLVYHHGLLSCLSWGVICLVTTAIPTIAVDTYFYLPLSSHALEAASKESLNSISYAYVEHGMKLPRVVWSTLNLVLYNMFPHGTGSELYGVEKWHFYLRNLALNFNLALVLALALLFFLPLMLLFSYTKPVSSATLSKSALELALKQRSLCFNGIVWSSPFFFWLGFLTMLPHKEERFMFVVYPQLCFAAACTCVIIETSFLAADARTSPHRLPPFGSIGPSALKMPYAAIFRNRCLFLLALLYLIISFARIAALIQYYNAPVMVYGWLGQHIQSHQHNIKNLNEEAVGDLLRKEESVGEKIRVCVGKEWYRFPSHFLLPDNTELVFVASEFSGELPRQFDASYGSHGPWGGNLFNDVNQLQHDIFQDISSCDYVIDLKLNSGDHQKYKSNLLEPWFDDSVEKINHASNTQCDDVTKNNEVCAKDEEKGDEQWKAIHSVNFLDAENTPTLARIFYIPIIANVYLQQTAQYVSYQVMQPSPEL